MSANIRILYIENEPLFCDLFKAAVSSCGYTVDVAHNGKDGLALYAEQPYDIVAIDCHLPDMTRLDIARKFHADNPDLPLLIVAGKGSESFAAEALALGVVNYLIKDKERVYLELLPSIILDLLERARQGRERRQTQQQHDRLLSAIEKSSEGFILFDANDEFVYANQKYKELYPSEVRDLVPGKTFRDIVKRCAYEGIVTSAIGREEEWIEKRVASHQALTNVSEQQISSGSWVRISEYRTEDGGIFGIRTDISEQKKAEEEIQFLANHDALTGLPSLRLGQDRLAMAIAAARRHEVMAGLMFIDLDGFKDVNDTEGHDAGDFVLKGVAERLMACVREVDSVARIGGDEFIIVLTDLTETASVEGIANKIIQSVGEPFEYNDKPLQIGASVGLAVFPNHGEDEEALMKSADGAMYRVKKMGKNNFAWAASPDSTIGNRPEIKRAKQVSH